MGARQHGNVRQTVGLFALPAMGRYHVYAAYQSIYFMSDKYSLVKGAPSVIACDPSLITAGGAELTLVSVIFDHRQRSGYDASCRTVIAAQLVYCKMRMILL